VLICSVEKNSEKQKAHQNLFKALEFSGILVFNK
jgi:hypothetical protein